ncbi:HD domain-containing protein [Aminobacter anthyllidis]|uniref:HD domain-containing protein n=1 Tax=Aminobacter anthyllidis TaxID=1035067 RepID=UPI002455FB10|nr:HD domain-containing protein [Aminobacter anthyllidis]MDH4987692.1 HD domain-containing protein [Aminobacter anthyllidis]
MRIMLRRALRNQPVQRPPGHLQLTGQPRPRGLNQIERERQKRCEPEQEAEEMGDEAGVDHGKSSPRSYRFIQAMAPFGKFTNYESRMRNQHVPYLFTACYVEHDKYLVRFSMHSRLASPIASWASDYDSLGDGQMPFGTDGKAKSQRIRDPLHNLIEFDTGQFEQTMWRVLQTRPFQRLRRIRQLGFSEFVFPGATHTRFAHSVGVFHIARQLMGIIESDPAKRTHQSHVALAAALVHDLGHGMFSHAFEDVGKKLGLSMAMHENVSDALIRHSEVSDVLNGELGRGFSEEVADVIRNKNPGNLFDAVVSSQFDADRLDYMQRDRLMTGVQGSGVDSTWILANLEVGTVPTNADEEAAGEIKTLVLGPKAFHAAEHYILSLFQLYPNVYLHKTTRGAEKIFSALILKIYNIIKSGNFSSSGLPENHPIIVFLSDPDNLEKALHLDDAVFWGSLHFLCDAKDKAVSEYARRLQDRNLLKCIDIRQEIEGKFPIKRGLTLDDRREREAKITLKVKSAIKEIEEIASKREADNKKEILVDQYKRSPYKKFQDSQTPLNQILIRRSDSIQDMAHLSSVVSGADSFEVDRVYICDDDAEARTAIKKILQTSEGEK